MRLLLVLLSMTVLLFGSEAADIVKKVEDNLRGKDAYMKMKMTITSVRHKRTVELESWAIGKEKSFMKILYPPKDRGITFLKLDKQLWQSVPKIERIVKIPPSMMLQSWMGSDFTNDDMVRESSLVDDYDPAIVAKEGHVVTIAFTPKPDAAVVWGKIVSEIDTRTYTQIHDVFYDDFGEPVREMFYSDVKTFGTHQIPTLMRIKPLEKGKEKNETTVTLYEVVYDKGVSERYFTKQALKRYSR
ncbi:MAG: outer membrane lipoprotein-sorting protein [Campylobacterales bacterium]